jgi:hypothetical protein
MNIEDRLHGALRRRSPSAAFTERTLAAVTDSDRVPRRTSVLKGSSRSRSVLLGLAASLILALAAAGIQSGRRASPGDPAALGSPEGNIQSERVKHAVETALRVTSEKLVDVQIRIAAFNARQGATHEQQPR